MRPSGVQLAVTAAPVEPSTPVAATDALLDAALAAHADYVWLEPMPCDDDHYVVSIERGGQVLATASIDRALGTAVIARLAFLTEVDLTARHATTGTTRVRDAEHERELVFTLRPGAELRGEAMLLTRSAGPPPGDAAPVRAELQPGDQIEHYCIQSRLGAGGMGNVYHVEHATLGRRYALKVLHARVLERDASSADQFLREARAASRIQHPHIIDVFDFGYLADGRPYFVMELLEGTSLGDVLDDGALSPTQALVIARQLGEALAAAHDAGVIHADISTSNVLLQMEGELLVKLVDFGLARLRGPTGAPQAISDVIFGTPCYIAPELVRGLPADERSDQYSFGVVLFEMLAGQPPYMHESIRELCLMHLRDPVPVLASPHGPLPDELGRLVERCMHKSPGARYPSMRALLAELTEVARLVERRGWRRWLAP